MQPNHCTAKEQLRCPRCKELFVIKTRCVKKIMCPKCGWDQNFIYVAVEE